MSLITCIGCDFNLPEDRYRYRFDKRMKTCIACLDYRNQCVIQTRNATKQQSLKECGTNQHVCSSCFRAKDLTEYKQRKNGTHNKTCIRCLDLQRQARLRREASKR